MTKRQIKSYILRWQRLLRLEEWDIRLETVSGKALVEKDDTNNVATIRISRSIMEATIKLALDQKDEEIAESIRHELLHLALDDLGDLFRALAGRVSPDACSLAYTQGADLEERTVIRIERMVNELLRAQKGNSDAG